MSQEDFHFVPCAIQIELLHCDPHVGVRISPFVYAYYLIFLCYHGLGQCDNRDRALHQLVDTVNNPQSRGLRRHQSYNIAVHCLLIAGHTKITKDLFFKTAHFTYQLPSLLDKQNAAYYNASLF